MGEVDGLAESESVKRVNVRYTAAKEYRRLAATGAYGGVNPQGEIVFDFYVEHRELPDSFVLEVSEDGPSKETKHDGQIGFVRERQVGIVLRPDLALTIGNWLIDQAKKVGVPQNAMGPQSNIAH